MHLLLFLTACGTPKEADTASIDSSVDTQNESDSGSDSDSGAHTETGEDSDSGGDSDSGVDTDTGGDTDTGEVLVDADGDSYLSDVDCDDNDSTIWPGAEEWCDAKDQDCDGDTLGPGVCAKPQRAGEIAAVLSTGDGVYLVPDLTGDSVVDLMGSSTDVPYPDGSGSVARGLSLYGGGAVPAAAIDAPAGSTQSWADGLRFSLYEIAPFIPGDLDGDGLNDIVFVSSSIYYEIAVHLAPFPLDGTSIWMDDTPTVWTAPITNVDSWMPYTAAGDFDLDGRIDLVGAEGGGYPGEFASFDVFYGGEWGDNQVRVATEYKYGSATAITRLEDLDGDGIDDIHVESGPFELLISGADLRGADGAYDTDLAWATFTLNGTGPEGSIYGGDAFHTAGDWTGDGRSDLLVTAATSETLGYEHGEVFVFDAADLMGEIGFGAAIGSWVGNATGYSSGAVAVLDFDGDGEKEVLFEDRDFVYLTRHELPSLRTPMSGLRYEGSLLSRGPPMDLNNDGYDDWMFYEIDDHTNNLLLGWPIPWDDPSVW